MSRCDLCTDSCEAYRLEELPPLLRTKHVAHICPACSEWVEGVHQRMVSTLAPRMRSAIAQRNGLEPRTPWWRQLIERFAPPADLPPADPPPADPPPADPALTDAERELIGNGLAYIIREYPTRAEDARQLLKRLHQVRPTTPDDAEAKSLAEEDAHDPGAHHVGCPTPGWCSEHGCHGACLPAEDGISKRAADMLTAYAELIRRDGATHIDEHHYLPEVEFIAQELRNRATPTDTTNEPRKSGPSALG